MLTARQLWRSQKTPTAENNLDLVLCLNARLPVQHWRCSFFFTGAPDSTLLELTSGRFPAKFIPGKTHPVFVLKKLPDNTGARVCPCSTKKPFKGIHCRYIGDECHLEPTGYRVKKSYLIEKIQFNIPGPTAYQLSFKGEVPAECIKDENLSKQR